MSLVYKNLPYIKPHKILSIVAKDYATIFLDSQLVHAKSARYSFIGIDPAFIITPESGLALDEQLECFEALKPLSTALAAESNMLPPFTGGLMGYLSYDYAQQLEPILASDYVEHLLVPDYWFGLYNQVFAFDNIEHSCYLLITELSGTNSSQLLAKLRDIYDRAYALVEPEPGFVQKLTISSNFTPKQYISAVEQAIEYIKAGDIFEANIAQCFSAKLSGDYDAYKLYRYLHLNNPAPFAAYLNLGKLKILSASPERFIKVTGNCIEARPIKGTSRRDADILVDNLLAQALQSSAKDRAENTMIVDLMRNDLSKICVAHSVVVSQLCALESFTNVHHLVSVINGELKPGIKPFDIIRAAFPAGSISGAPKIRAMQIIKELEQNTPRGVSYGNIGYLGLNGNIDLSVSIRTISIYNDLLSFHVGGAVTLGSDPLAEYEETMLKGQAFFESFAQ